MIHGKYDKLTKGLPGLEAAEPCPVGGGCGAGSDIVEANRCARGNPAANYCESMHKRCLECHEETPFGMRIASGAVTKLLTGIIDIVYRLVYS
jgi:hypothetical protein